MVKNLQKYVLLFILLLCLKNSKAATTEDYIAIVRQYQSAYNHSDFSLLDSITFSQKEYSDLVTKIDKEFPGCLNDYDKTFDVNTFKRDFQKSHLYTLKTDTIVISKISDFTTCSDLVVKKVTCLVYFKKLNKSAPVNLIVVDLKDKRYKILIDIINENYFANEKF